MRGFGGNGSGVGKVLHCGGIFDDQNPSEVGLSLNLLPLVASLLDLRSSLCRGELLLRLHGGAAFDDGGGGCVGHEKF